MVVDSLPIIWRNKDIRTRPKSRVTLLIAIIVLRKDAVSRPAPARPRPASRRKTARSQPGLAGAASHHDVTVFKELVPSLPQTTVLGDEAYADHQLSLSLAAQDSQLLIPAKNRKHES